MRLTQLVFTTVCVLGGNTDTTASAIGSRRTRKLSAWDRQILPRGGAAFFNKDSDADADVVADAKHLNVTVEDYVTKMKKKDRETDDPESSEEAADASSNNPAASETIAPDNDDDNDNDPAIVGVKSHGSSSKKSNAVGDPDDDDDDDDDDDQLSEFSDWEEIQDHSFEPQVQVQVELVGEEETISNSNNNGGGVGVKVTSNRASGRRKNKWRSSSSSSAQKQLSHDQTRLLQAWMPHVYFPPTLDALSYLDTNARLLDAGSKSRLDRRTLYAALMLEWGSTTGSGTKSSSGTRKFLPSPTSQALQAALSMATQPQWRLSSPGMNGIRLYAPDQETSGKGTTLGMQETVAMALVRNNTTHSLHLLETTVTAGLMNDSCLFIYFSLETL